MIIMTIIILYILIAGAVNGLLTYARTNSYMRDTREWCKIDGEDAALLSMIWPVVVVKILSFELLRFVFKK